MKIGLVTGEFPPMQGGIGAFSQELAKAFYQLNCDVHIITSRAAAPQEDNKRRAGDPYILSYATLYPFINRWRWPSIAKVVDIAFRYEFDILNIQYQPAAYNMSSAAINMLPWRLHGALPTVVTFHDLKYPYLFPKAGRLRQTAVSTMANRSQGVIVTNTEDFERQTGKVKPPLIQIPIGSNIDARAATPGEIMAVRQELGLEDSTRLIGYFGFVQQSKGADTLVAALSELPPEVHLVFIGGRTGSSDAQNNQSFLDYLEEKITAGGLSQRVHWTGFVPEHHVSAYLNTAELLVMPYQDGVSLRRGTLMAALAHGRPLLTTKPVLPINELVDRESVWYVPAGDETALAAAVSTLLGNAAMRAYLGRGASAAASNFTWDKIAAKTLRFYEKIIG